MDLMHSVPWLTMEKLGSKNACSRYHLSMAELGLMCIKPNPIEWVFILVQRIFLKIVLRTCEFYLKLDQQWWKKNAPSSCDFGLNSAPLWITISTPTNRMFIGQERCVDNLYRAKLATAKGENRTTLHVPHLGSGSNFQAARLRQQRNQTWHHLLFHAGLCLHVACYWIGPIQVCTLEQLKVSRVHSSCR